MQYDGYCEPFAMSNSGRRRALLPPVQFGPEVRCQQFDDLAFARMAADLRLTENDLPVNCDLQPAGGPRFQRDRSQDGGPSIDDISRQTDGFLGIISGDAEFDLDGVLRVDAHTGNGTGPQWCPRSPDSPFRSLVAPPSLVVSA